MLELALDKRIALEHGWPQIVSKYKSRSFRNLVYSFKWDRDDADKMWNISARRCQRRLDTYIIPGELERSKGSIRFGNKKEGHGYHEKRGDFCLVGGAFKTGHLSVFYRSVELIGGLHYDLAIFKHVEDKLGRIKDVTIYAPHAFIFALKGNSNEKLYKKLKQYYYQKRVAP